MLRCMLNKRKDNRRLKKHEDEIRKVTEKVIQDTIKNLDVLAKTVKPVEPV